MTRGRGVLDQNVFVRISESGESERTAFCAIARCTVRCGRVHPLVHVPTVRKWHGLGGRVANHRAVFLLLALA